MAYALCALLLGPIQTECGDDRCGPALVHANMQRSQALCSSTQDFAGDLRAAADSCSYYLTSVFLVYTTSCLWIGCCICWCREKRW